MCFIDVVVENNKMINCAIITITISISFLAFTLPLSNTYAQNETRSFINCYESAAGAIFMQNLISPKEYIIDLTDLDIKQYISNWCNYIYEKSGKWLNLEDWRSKYDPETIGFNEDEFDSRYYPNGYPESVRKMWKLQQSR